MPDHDQIQDYHAQGHTQAAIAQLCNCDKTTVRNCLEPAFRQDRIDARQKYRDEHKCNEMLYDFQRPTRKPSCERADASDWKAALSQKLRRFGNTGRTIQERTRMSSKRNFTDEQFYERIGPNPHCYLTGLQIDLSKSSTWSPDHIIPRKYGGPSTLENLGLSTRTANQMKWELYLHELKDGATLILEYKFNQLVVDLANPLSPDQLSKIINKLNQEGYAVIKRA